MQSLIGQISEKMAREMGYDTDKQEVLYYSLTMLVNNLQAVLILWLLSWAVGVSKLAFIALGASAVLRVASGGAHASSSLRCATIASLMFTFCGVSAMYVANLEVDYVLLMIAVVLGIYSISKYAPADVPEKPIESQAQKTTLLRASWIVFISEILLIIWLTLAGNYSSATAAILGLTWQTFTITPLGYTVMKFFDSALVTLSKRVFIKHSND